jgi:hypothetical protein
MVLGAYMLQISIPAITFYDSMVVDDELHEVISSVIIRITGNT